MWVTAIEHLIRKKRFFLKNLFPEEQAKSRLPTLDFGRANFALYMHLLGRILCKMVLERRGVQKSWLIFNSCLV